MVTLDGHVRGRIVEMRNVKRILIRPMVTASGHMGKTQDPVDLIQRCWLFEHLIKGLLLIFMINYSVTIQLAEPNHGSWMVGNSVADVFSWRFKV